MQTKIIQAVLLDGLYQPIDGSSPPKHPVLRPEWISEGVPVVDGSGAPIIWYWTKDETQLPQYAPPPTPRDMTDEQVAADPLFPLVARIIKERRKSGPTSKRPTDLTVDDRGFCYWNTDRKAPEYWHITGKWFDAMGVALT